MSALDDITDRANACAVEICWRQWRTLVGLGLAAGTGPTASIIDPEALVLLSLAVRDHERRLDDRLRWWAGEGSALLSVQRMRTLLRDYPGELSGEIAWFAAMAVGFGDPRWRSLIHGQQSDDRGRPGKGPRELRLVAPAALMLRLRAGFGVGAKADLLTFLIGVASRGSGRSGPATVDEIANAISYSVASTRRAASDMTLARFVTVSAERPARYSADVRAWARLLQLRDPGRAVAERVEGDTPGFDVPVWRSWAQLFAFLAHCSWLARDARLAGAPPVVQASHLRDLAERFHRPMSGNGIGWVDPRMFAGEAYLGGFRQLVDQVVGWVVESA